MQVKRLKELATEMVGDSGHPDLFFVTIEGNVRMITTEFKLAHDYWRSLPINIETSLTNRRDGFIAYTEPVGEGSRMLVTYDHTLKMGLHK